MGTSASSKGPGGGVPMVPPWVPVPLPPNPPPGQDGAAPEDGDGQRAARIAQSRNSLRKRSRLRWRQPGVSAARG